MCELDVTLYPYQEQILAWVLQGAQCDAEDSAHTDTPGNAARPGEARTEPSSQ